MRRVDGALLCCDSQDLQYLAALVIFSFIGGVRTLLQLKSLFTGSSAKVCSDEVEAIYDSRHKILRAEYFRQRGETISSLKSPNAP